MKIKIDIMKTKSTNIGMIKNKIGDSGIYSQGRLFLII